MEFFLNKLDQKREIRFDDAATWSETSFEKRVLNGMKKEPVYVGEKDKELWTGIEIIRPSTQTEIDKFKKQKEERLIKTDSEKFGI